jgi:hypothetical protein
MTRLALAAAIAAALVAGALGHAALSSAPAHPPAEPVARANASVATCAASLGRADLAALRSDLAQLIDERLAKPSSAPPAASVPDPPAPEAVAAAATAGQLIDAALARGSWNDADRQAFHTALVDMNDAQRRIAISQLLTALNERRLHTDVVGPAL